MALVKQAPEAREFDVDPAAAPILPVEYCLNHGVVILGSVPADRSSPVTVGMLTASDQRVVEDLSARLGHPVVPVVMSSSDLRRTIGRLHDLPGAETEGGLLAIDAGRMPRLDGGLPPPMLLESLLAEGISRRATDIHLEAYGHGIELRLRIDGVLRPLLLPVSHGTAARVVSRIKVLCGIDLSEHRRAQDGRFSVLFTKDGAVRRVDIRVSVLPGLHGQDVALRVLDPERFILNLADLDMPDGMLQAYRRLTRLPHGLLLASGPTGAGKTTTMYATLRELQGESLKILSVEEPVEYEFSKVNQKNVTAQMGFADHLRAFLRSNPDVLHVGEIRDPETAEIAVRAGTTGHRVLGTLHTRDAVSSVARLRALGVADDYLSEVLVGVLGQRLVRRLCDACKKLGPAPPDLVPLFFARPTESPSYLASGCPSCDGTGYRGLVGVFELFEPNETIIQAIAKGTPVEELRRIALAGGWIPLVEDALRKVSIGVTSLEEVARRIPPKYRLGP
jgi:type II secretory ATPase GspE/PulE/Tfp pilus assembly ATPase PilB-like protein